MISFQKGSEYFLFLYYNEYKVYELINTKRAKEHLKLSLRPYLYACLCAQIGAIMNDKSELIVGGYCFGSIEDAEAARQELKKIEYLEQHMDYEEPENMLLIYKKAVDTRVFQTPIGWEYLKKLQDKLSPYEDLSEEVSPIMLYTVFAHRVGDEIKVPEPRITPKQKDPFKRWFAISILFNIFLVIAVIAMFAITLTSDIPNILNYENTIVNKYSTWEQDLTERENLIREKERELSIEK